MGERQFNGFYGLVKIKSSEDESAEKRATLIIYEFNNLLFKQ